MPGSKHFLRNTRFAWPSVPVTIKQIVRSLICFVAIHPLFESSKHVAGNVFSRTKALAAFQAVKVFGRRCVTLLSLTRLHCPLVMRCVRDEQCPKDAVRVLLMSLKGCVSGVRLIALKCGIYCARETQLPFFIYRQISRRLLTSCY